MFKVPWAEPIEKGLRPFQGIVVIGLIFIVLTTIYVIIKGNNVSKTGWLVWLLVP